jgi:L-fucose mutarotase
MQKVPQDADKEIPIWKVFQEELHKAKQAPVVLKQIERFAFYERAKQAFAVVATGERSQYGNLILTKGICP